MNILEISSLTAIIFGHLIDAFQQDHSQQSESRSSYKVYSLIIQFKTNPMFGCDPIWMQGVTHCSIGWFAAVAWITCSSQSCLCRMISQPVTSFNDLFMDKWKQKAKLEEINCEFWKESIMFCFKSSISDFTTNYICLDFVIDMKITHVLDLFF